ncbi:MAG: tyrosine-protein phosphatase [Candidatus Heteroscillospira sp.]
MYKRPPMEGIPNLRDLGGWAVTGGMTRWGVFLRSAVPKALTAGDRSRLEALGLRTVLDFRSQPECTRAPDPLSAMDGVRYVQLPMFDSAAAGAALSIQPEADFEWGSHYVRMAVEQKSWMASVVRALTESEGCTLFHCTTGKDRAGLISALILSVCGVCDEDIAADYCVSRLYLREMFMEMEHSQNFCGGNLNSPFYRTPPEAIKAFLNFLQEEYGGAEGYLINCGMKNVELERLRTKLIDKI